MLITFYDSSYNSKEKLICLINLEKQEVIAELVVLRRIMVFLREPSETTMVVIREAIRKSEPFAKNVLANKSPEF